MLTTAPDLSQHNVGHDRINLGGKTLPVHRQELSAHALGSDQRASVAGLLSLLVGENAVLRLVVVHGPQPRLPPGNAANGLFHPARDAHSSVRRCFTHSCSRLRRQRHR